MIEASSKTTEYDYSKVTKIIMDKVPGVIIDVFIIIYRTIKFIIWMIIHQI